ncbi:MAG: hypothetical protein J2P37_18240 [Ktedonobacteraceae bacterium]|nr:hypothetical protein [Ktedonobacteraceae bacterium]MBO0792343.1 hypothetical protein [Ktedonobacteraceae bacterium]
MRDQEQLSMFESDEMPDQRPAPYVRRLVVGAFYLCFVTCLVALLLNWIVPDHVPMWLPTWLVPIIEHNRVATLLLPPAGLLICYWSLRSMTGDILARPDRYLDERQKLLRDQAHRSAYKVLKRACLVAPILVLLCALLWQTPAPAQPAPTPQTVTFTMHTLGDWYVIKMGNDGVVYGVVTPQTPSDQSKGSDGQDPIKIIKLQSPLSSFTLHTITAAQPAATSPRSWLSTPANIALFFGSLLLSLFLMVTALPMAILARKEKDEANS